MTRQERRKRRRQRRRRMQAGILLSLVLVLFLVLSGWGGLRALAPAIDDGQMGKSLLSMSGLSFVASLLGTMPLTAAPESAAGQAMGGRTGRMAYWTAAFLALALFLEPTLQSMASFPSIFAPAYAGAGLALLLRMKPVFAGSLADNLHMEAMIRVRVGYGNVVTQLPEIAESYQEARMALEVGRVFYAKYDTISYGKLGIGRLIYQLPMSLCNMFIKEVFGEKIPDILDDEEAMSTINKFFENNLNISETARQLYVHRNTLVYRLERIEKAIGLDIRTFDDAMTFRIAVMVIAHMRDQM